MFPINMLLVLSQPDFLKHQLCPVITGSPSWWRSSSDAPGCRR
jgi:hypothetical protein